MLQIVQIINPFYIIFFYFWKEFLYIICYYILIIFDYIYSLFCVLSFKISCNIF